MTGKTTVQGMIGTITAAIILVAVTGWTWNMTTTEMMTVTATATVVLEEAGLIQDAQIPMIAGTITIVTATTEIADAIMTMMITPAVVQTMEAAIHMAAPDVAGTEIIVDIQKQQNADGTTGETIAALAHLTVIAMMTEDQEASADVDGLEKAPGILPLQNVDGITGVNT